MKCPVSMLPGSGHASGSVLFVIGVIATIAYAIQARKSAQAK